MIRFSYSVIRFNYSESDRAIDGASELRGLSCGAAWESSIEKLKGDASRQVSSPLPRCALSFR